MAIIATVWCQQKNSWLRFETEDGEHVTASFSDENQLNWTLVQDGIWSVDYKHGDVNPLQESYSLHEGVLYKTDFNINKLTGSIRISQYRPQGWFLCSGASLKIYDPFVKYKKDISAVIPYEKLPRTPEEHRDFLAAQEEARRRQAFAEQQAAAARWHGFIGSISSIRAAGGQRIAGLTEAQKVVFQTQLNDEMEGINLDNAHNYLSELERILEDDKHRITSTTINSFAAQHVLGLTRPGVKLIDGMPFDDISEIRNHRKNFINNHACFRSVENSMGIKRIYFYDKDNDNLIDITDHQGIGRITPFFGEAPQGQDGRLLEFHDLDIVAEVAGVERQRLTVGGLRPEIKNLQKDYNKAMLTAERDALREMLYPKVVAGERKDVAAAAGSPNRQYMDERKESLDNPPPLPDLQSLKTAVTEAQSKYDRWYRGENLRGNRGCFTFFRHGSTGQQNALVFKTNIDKKHTVAEATDYINALLDNPKTRFHRHSFASFLLDELKNIRNSSWSFMAPDPASNRYTLPNRDR